MKSFKQFISESVNIAGDFNGNLYINSSDSQPESTSESFFADILWEGKLYRLEVEGKIMNRNELTERLQVEYPGAIVQQMYPTTYNENKLTIKNSQRYQPERLSWSD